MKTQHRREPFLIDNVPTARHRVREPLAPLLWRYRQYLLPVAVVFGVFAAGGVAFNIVGPVPTFLLSLAAVVAVVMWARKSLDRKAEQTYAVVIVVLACSWVTTACLIGPSDPVLVRTLFIAGGVCAVPWWLHRRVRAQVRVERTVAAWPTVADKAGLTGSRLVNVVVTTWGWTGRVFLSAGQTARDVATRLRALESALQLPVGSARAEPWVERADVALVRVVETDPHESTITWPGTPSERISQPVDVGPYDDGDTCQVPLYDQLTGTHHALVAGTNGSGKSGLLNLLASHAVTASDAVVWGIDLKGGAELRPWEAALDWLATTQDEAAEMLRALRSIIDARGQNAGSRTWQVSRKNPALIVLVDEAAEIPSTSVPDLESIARRARALGVALVLATQYPTVSAVGSAQVRAQLRTRAAFRFMRSSEASTVLADSAVTDPSVIRKDRPGCCYVQAANADRGALVRCYWVSDETVSHVVETWQDRQPELDELSVNAAGLAYAGRHARQDVAEAEPHSAENGEPARQRDEPLTALTEKEPPESQKRTNDEAREALRTALIEAGSDGISVADLCRATDRRKSWIYRELDGLESVRKVERPEKRGRFRATADLRDRGT